MKPRNSTPAACPPECLRRRAPGPGTRSGRSHLQNATRCSRSRRHRLLDFTDQLPKISRNRQRVSHILFCQECLKKKRTLPYHLFLLKKVILSPTKQETHKLGVKPHSCPPFPSVPQISPPSFLISRPLPPPTPASLLFSESARPSLPQSLYVHGSLSLPHLSPRSSRLTSSNHVSLD